MREKTLPLLSQNVAMQIAKTTRRADCGASLLFYITMWRSAPIQQPILKTVTSTPPINLKLENTCSITSKVSLIKKHSPVAGLKNRIHTFLPFQTTGAQGYLAYCFSSLECVVARFTLDISFPTIANSQNVRLENLTRGGPDSRCRHSKALLLYVMAG